MLQVKLLRTQSPVFLLDTSYPANVYQIVPGRIMDTVDNAAAIDDIPPPANDLPTEELIRMIENKEVTVKSHRIVDIITLVTAGGEIRLTLERSGDLEPVGIMPRSGSRGGLSGQDKLLLSLLGGGGGGCSKVRGIERLKN
uniref:Uncharacterized protein n=2 Tax=Anopheles albimanus TaxID=7167 RepID=A0A8W7JZP1_ANOAL